MSLKKKLFTTISMFCLTIAMLMVGVWAVSSDQVSFGGTITFTATNILATISGEVSGTASDPTLDDLEYTSAGGPSTDALKTWSNNLAFKPEGTPFTIKITIQNDSNRKLYWDISDMAETNATISKSLSTYSLNTVNEIAENGKAEFTITITLTSTDNSVTGAYAYNINLFDISEKPVDITNSNHAYLTFGTPDTANKTISVTGCDTSVTTAEIPAKVIKSGQIYEVTSIGNYAFLHCKITSITIPNSVTSIGNSAFQSCSGLTSVIIGNGVESIGDSAFQSCSGLTSVIIGNGVESIGDSAFQSCTSLTSITIPDSVTSIGNSAFFSCTSLTSVTIPDSVTSISEGTFNDCTGLTSITIPDTVTSIGDAAFNGCSSLTSITIPDSVETIGSSAFSGCTGLTSVIIGTGVTSISANAFNNCSGLTSIIIPDSVTSIGGSAFFHCSGLTSITIPDSVIKIGNNAFMGCSSLKTVYVDSAVVVNNYYTACNNSCLFNNTTSVYIHESITVTNSKFINANESKVGEYYRFTENITDSDIGGA